MCVYVELSHPGPAGGAHVVVERAVVLGRPKLLSCFHGAINRRGARVMHSEYKTKKTLNTGRKEMFYLTTHSTHFIYGYMASDIWLRTILIVRKETRCRHIGYWLTARVLLYAPSRRQDNTYHGLCYTSRGALTGTRNSSVHPTKDLSRRPIAPWANALTTELHPAPLVRLSP